VIEYFLSNDNLINMYVLILCIGIVYIKLLNNDRWVESSKEKWLSYCHVGSVSMVICYDLK
jgi:hypothetical protein